MGGVSLAMGVMTRYKEQRMMDALLLFGSLVTKGYGNYPANQVHEVPVELIKAEESVISLHVIVVATVVVVLMVGVYVLSEEDGMLLKICFVRYMIIIEDLLSRSISGTVISHFPISTILFDLERAIVNQTFSKRLAVRNKAHNMTALAVYGRKVEQVSSIRVGEAGRYDREAHMLRDIVSCGMHGSIIDMVRRYEGDRYDITSVISSVTRIVTRQSG